MAQLATDLRSEFEARVERIPFETCWHWTGTVNSMGYGRLGRAQAHRVAYELYVGPVPEGLTLDHLCRVHDCVNPAHLEPVTNRENVLRGIAPAAINAKRTECKYGHPLTDDNVRLVLNRYGFYGRYCVQCTNDRSRDDWRKDHPDWDGVTQLNPRGDFHRWGEKHAMAKLTVKDVREIRSSDLSVAALCALYRVSKTTIRNVLSRATWMYVDMDELIYCRLCKTAGWPTSHFKSGVAHRPGQQSDAVSSPLRTETTQKAAPE